MLLTETSQVGELRWVVRHSADHPVSGGLPHSIQESAENIEPKPGGVTTIMDIDRRHALQGFASVAPITRG